MTYTRVPDIVTSSPHTRSLLIRHPPISPTREPADRQQKVSMPATARNSAGGAATATSETVRSLRFLCCCFVSGVDFDDVFLLRVRSHVLVTDKILWLARLWLAPSRLEGQRCTGCVKVQHGRQQGGQAKILNRAFLRSDNLRFRKPRGKLEKSILVCHDFRSGTKGPQRVPLEL